MLQAYLHKKIVKMGNRIIFIIQEQIKDTSRSFNQGLNGVPPQGGSKTVAHTFGS